jgi:hypothetical protein
MHEIKKKYGSIFNYLLLVLIIFFISMSPVFSATLLDWNNSIDAGQSWYNWTYYDGDPVGADDFGSPGWRKDDGQFYSSGSNWYPRIAEKRDYGNDTRAIIDINNRSPETTTGGSLKVYDTGDSSVHDASWWYLFGDNFGTQGLADSSTDRLSFYTKIEGLNSDIPTDGKISNGNMHFGTYLCWDDGGLGGEDCPKEADGNHYYHYLTVNDGAWLHVQLDQHPTHKRGGAEPNEPDNDPVFVSEGKHYYENMNGFYYEIVASQSQVTSYWIDEVILWNQTNTENEDSIGSAVWVGYWSATDKWEIGFGSVWPGRPMQATFEVRWSISPITNTNYSTATIVEPEYYEYGTTNHIRLSDGGWSKTAWTRFELPDSIETSNSKLYFAIRDVSSIANRDGYDSPTTNIKTIDYTFGAFMSDVVPPSNLQLGSSN